uniref:IFNL4 n=2 Tax=Pan TaxID=9596 RepID=A0A2I3SFP4_PANTR
MRPSVWAAVAAGLWVVCAVGAAIPQRCLLSHYRSLQPRTLAAVKALRNQALSWRSRNCSVRPRRDPPRPSLLCILRPTASPSALPICPA